MSDGTWTYTWEHGRQLSSMTDGTETWTYTYDANGRRTKRTNGTTTYEYIYNGDQLQEMRFGNKTLYFSYDANGVPQTVTYNNTVYQYVTNQQGDIISIQDYNGGVYATYSYNAWGELISNCTTHPESIEFLNPLRYRGYVYDHETGLYYLQSRYYNPEMGRFINADGVIAGANGELLGYNQFAYCFNNPANMSDSAGNWPKFLKEIGARIKHAVKIMTKIVLSPLKAISVEVGGGVGYGASVGVSVLGAPVEIGASTTITDSYVYENGKHDFVSTSSAEVSFVVAEIVGDAHSVGKSHSYFEEGCTCNAWDSTFGEKANCPANKKYSSHNTTFGVSAGIYLALGFEISIGIDLKAWGDELVSIYHESFTFKGYY